MKIVCFALLLLCAATAHASTDSLVLEASVVASDANAPLPLGSIASAALSSDGTLHLLDEQSRTIHRLTADGEWLEPLGRAGEAPGEFDMPQHLEILPGGECLVFGIFRRVSCIRVDGTPCDSPFGPRPYGRKGTAAMLYGTDHGPDGSLFVAYGDLRHRQDGSVEGPNLLLRLSASAPETLFVHQVRMAVGNMRPVDSRANKLLFSGWDISPVGRLATTTLENRYAFRLDGAPDLIDVEVFPGDREAIARFASEQDIDPDRLPLLHRLYWLDDEHLLLEPGATKIDPVPGSYATFDVVRTDGERLRRVRLDLLWDPEQDLDFLLDHWLVVLEGGKAARDMHYGAMARLAGQEGPSAQEADEEAEPRSDFVVRRYDLRVLR